MITEPEWESIRALVEKVIQQVIGDRRSWFTTGKVTKVDVAHKCVFLSEYGDQPIPIVGFDRTVKYYDTDNLGKVNVKTVTSTVVMPKVGQSVLVANELGTTRLPRCLGVIQGTNWIVPEED